MLISEMSLSAKSCCFEILTEMYLVVLYTLTTGGVLPPSSVTASMRRGVGLNSSSSASGHRDSLGMDEMAVQQLHAAATAAAAAGAGIHFQPRLPVHVCFVLLVCFVICSQWLYMCSFYVVGVFEFVFKIKFV
jgi:hypothetical protein